VDDRDKKEKNNDLINVKAFGGTVLVRMIFTRMGKGSRKGHAGLKGAKVLDNSHGLRVKHSWYTSIAHFFVVQLMDRGLPPTDQTTQPKKKNHNKKKKTQKTPKTHQTHHPKTTKQQTEEETQTVAIFQAG